jgi:hypothetical protein
MVRLMVASTLMGVFAGLCAWQYPLLSDLFWKKEVAVLAVMGLGVVIYGLAAFALGAVTLAEIKGALRREKGAAGVASGGEG